MQKAYGFVLASIPRFLFVGLFLVLFSYLSIPQSYAAGWTQIAGLGSNRIGGFVVDPTNPNILYAGTNNGLYKSTDGGSNWNNYQNGLPSGAAYINGLVINPANTNILYASVTLNGVYKSTDGGVNWTFVSPQITTFNVFEGIAIDPNHPDTVYIAVNGGGLWKTTDGGANWTETLGGDAGSPIVDPIQTTHVYVGDGPDWFKSTNNGTSWTATPPGTFGSGGGVGPTAVDSNNNSIIYVGEGGSNQDGLYKSTNTGASWTFLSNYPGGPFADQELTADPIRANAVYTSARDSAHIYGSSDAGGSWNELTGGTLGSAAKTMLVPANNPGILYAGTYAGLFYYPLNPDGDNAPVVSSLSNATLNPGDTYTANGSFTDSDSTSWTASVNYGDGGGWQPLTLSGMNFTLSHQYQASGTYTVIVAVTDNQGAIGSGTATITVNQPNTAPHVNSLNGATMNEGATYSENGSFTDSDSTSWTATVDYGDGSGTQPLTLTGMNFSLSHVYSTHGTYTVTVSVTDNQGATGTATATVTVQRQLVSLSPAMVWVGLKNSDDVGIKFDLLAEVYKDSTLVSSGELDSVAAGSSGFSNAKLDTISFNTFSPLDFPSGSNLSVKLYARNACSGSNKNSGTARLWFNDSAANSQFDATIGTSASNYFLLNNFLLGTSAGAGPKKTVDVAAGAKCSAFKSFGTWTITP